MNKHIDFSNSDNSDNEKNKVIDRNLREAYGQIHFRDEWAERVLRRLASESDPQSMPVKSSVSKSIHGSPWSRLLRRSRLALAASIVLTALGACYWLGSNPHRPDGTNSMDSDLAKRPTVPSDKLNKLPGDSNLQEDNWLREDSMLSTQSHQPKDTVIATPGYLAARLTDDPEFEIYMVLPTSVNNF